MANSATEFGRERILDDTHEQQRLRGSSGCRVRHLSGLHLFASATFRRRGFGARADGPYHLGFGRLGHDAARRRPYLEKAPLLYWTIAILYKIFGVHDWVARLPIVFTILGLVWLTTSFGVWAFGKRAGACRIMHGHVPWPLPFHARGDSRRNADVSDCAGTLGFFAASTRTTPSGVMGCCSRGGYRDRAPTEKPGRCRVSCGRRPDLSFPDEAVFRCADVEAAAAGQGVLHHRGDRRSVAHPRDAAKPALLCLDASCGAWPISRLSLVLFRQRAASSLSQPALPAGLRHRPAPLFLALSRRVVISLERLFPGDRDTFF